MTLSAARRQKERTPTTPKAITFFMPPERAEREQQVLKEEGRTMSEFLREANRLSIHSSILPIPVESLTRARCADATPLPTMGT